MITIELTQDDKYRIREVANWLCGMKEDYSRKLIYRATPTTSDKVDIIYEHNVPRLPDKKVLSIMRGIVSIGGTTTVSGDIGAEILEYIGWEEKSYERLHTIK